MKKILALVLVALLALSMTAAFAEAVDASTTFQVATLTVNGIKAGNVLKLYKIGTPMYDSATNDLSYSFVTGITEAEFKGVASDGYVLTPGSGAKELADKWAAAIAAGTITPSETIEVTATGDPGAAVKENLPAGYYVGVVSGNADTSIIYQNMLINAMPVANSAGDGYVAATIDAFTVKSTPEKITKANGVTFDHEAEIDTTDEYSVGDYVPYEIATTIPNYPTPSKEATFKITDTPTHLTDSIATSGDHALTVKVNGTAIDPSATTWSIARKDANDQDGFVITFEKDFILAHAGQSVLVEYEAQIKTDAVITTAGLTAENTASIIFNPNPNENTTVKPEDKTEDYTYGLVVLKYAEKADKEDHTEHLPNAEFKLVAANSAGDAPADPEDVLRTGKTDADGYIFWNGLAAGTYYLIETKAPANYRLDSTPRKVVLNKTTATGDNPTTGTTEAPVVEEYYNQIDVPNTEGTTLPSTGGIGTTIFYVDGGILVLGAVIFLVTKRRMNSND